MANEELESQHEEKAIQRAIQLSLKEQVILPAEEELAIQKAIMASLEDRIIELKEFKKAIETIGEADSNNQQISDTESIEIENEINSLLSEVLIIQKNLDQDSELTSKMLASQKAILESSENQEESTSKTNQELDKETEAAIKASVREQKEQIHKELLGRKNNGAVSSNQDRNGELSGLFHFDDEDSINYESVVSFESADFNPDSQNNLTSYELPGLVHSGDEYSSDESVEFDVTSVTYEEDVVGDVLEADQIIPEGNTASTSGTKKSSVKRESFLSKLMNLTRVKKAKQESPRSKNKKENRFRRNRYHSLK